MRTWLWLGLALATGSLGWSEEGLSRRVTAEEFREAGLAKLSPAELARLDAIFRKYGAASSATAAEATRQPEIEAAAARVAQAEARAKSAERDAAAARVAEQAAKAEQKKAEEGLLSKAKKVFVPTGTKVEVAALETEIDGPFDGWEQMTTWRMKDGTIWRVDNKPAPYHVDRVQNPKVRILPAAISGYWLEFVDVNLRVRVRQLSAK